MFSIIKFLPLVFGLFLLGCGGSSDFIEGEKTKADIQGNDLDILPELMNMPAQPVSVKWTITDERRGLMALFLYSHDDYEYILSHSKKWGSNGNKVLFSTMAFDIYDNWLPEKAKQNIDVIRFGDIAYKLMGIDSYDTDIYVAPAKSDYRNGKFIALSNNYIFLVLAQD